MFLNKKFYFLLPIILFCSVAQGNNIATANNNLINMVSNPANIEPLNQNQINQIEQVIHNYIVNNPTVLIEAGKKLQAQEQEAQLKRIKDNVAKYKTELFSTNTSGRAVTGNPNGKIIIAEFTQHPCHGCKEVVPFIDKLIKNNPDIKLITIYWPFLGNDAIYAAKAVLAAHKQNKFNELNQALSVINDKSDPMTKNKIDAIIKSIPGLDIKKLHKDMDAKELEAGLKANFKLVKDLEIGGTPTFVFTNNEMTKFSLVLGRTNEIEKDLNKSLGEVADDIKQTEKPTSNLNKT